MGGGQIDHQSALGTFEKSLERIVGLPKNEDSGSEVGVASPPAPVSAPALEPIPAVPSLAPARASPSAVAPAPMPARRRHFGIPVSSVRAVHWRNGASVDSVTSPRTSGPCGVLHIKARSPSPLPRMLSFPRPCR